MVNIFFWPTCLWANFLVILSFPRRERRNKKKIPSPLQKKSFLIQRILGSTNSTRTFHSSPFWSYGWTDSPVMLDTQTLRPIDWISPVTQIYERIRKIWWPGRDHLPLNKECMWLHKQTQRHRQVCVEWLLVGACSAVPLSKRSWGSVMQAHKH